MARTRRIEANIEQIQSPESTNPMSPEECVACLAAIRLSNREAAYLIGHQTSHFVQQWTVRRSSVPPMKVARWLRGLAGAILVAEAAWPPPDMGVRE